MALKGLILAATHFEGAAWWTREKVSSVFSEAAAARGRTGTAMAGLLVTVAAAALLVCVAVAGQGPAGSERRTEEALALNKELEFAAIQAILRHLDDNHDGSVDLQESEEFVQMELKDDTEKSHRFHQTDSQITSEELWLSWQQNEVFHWSSQEVVQWLTVDVELPQYRDIFYKLNITGRHLPRLANNTGGMLQSLLGVTDSQHKQKLRLRAMDLVLFGPPNGKSSVWKDVVVALSVSLCVVGVVHALRQRRVTQKRIDKFLESFREKERELRTLQERLEQQKGESGSSEETDRGGRERDRDSSSPKSSPDLSPSPESEISLPPLSATSFTSSRSGSFDTSLARAQEEIDMLRSEVENLTAQLSSRTISHSLLQSLLQDSCRYEREHVERRRRDAQDEITRAQKVCDKIKKRRASLFGTFHLANSSALEEAGLQITRAVNNMQKVSESFEEYHQRWRRIEQVCNFPVISATAGLNMAATATDSSSSPAFSLARDLSSSSLKSLERRGSIDTLSSPPDSFSRHSEGYSSSDANSLSFTPNGSPSLSLKGRRSRHSLSGAGGSLGQSHTHLNSASSLYNHQYSCPAVICSKSGSQTMPHGRARTLPPTSSLPRNFVLSSRMVGRQDSYNAAVEGENDCHGDSQHNDKGVRRRLSDSGRERVAVMAAAAGRRHREGGSSRRGSIVRRQSAVGLSAVSEEESTARHDQSEGAEPVAMSTNHTRGGVSRITMTSTQSTV